MLGGGPVSRAFLSEAPIKRESLAVVAEGVCGPADFDRLWLAAGLGTVGVFRLIDKVGLDVALDIKEDY